MQKIEANLRRFTVLHDDCAARACMNGRVDVSVGVSRVLCSSVLCGVLTGPSRCPLLCTCALPLPEFTGDLDGHWWDHSSWHSSEASPMSLVRHAGSCLDTDPDPSPPPILSLPPCMSVLPDPRVFSHFMFPSLYLHLCMLFFCFSFCFLSHTCRGESKGKKKNF